MVDRLGPDPLREDADWTVAWARVARSRKPIGALLMDQGVLAGVGNVYRAEVLYRHRMDPHRPGNTLRRGQFEAIWHDLVALMHDGVRTGRIDTVHAEHNPEAMGRPPRRGRPRRRGVRLPAPRTALPGVRGHRAHRAARRPQPVLVPTVPAEVPVPRAGGGTVTGIPIAGVSATRH